MGIEKINLDVYGMGIGFCVVAETDTDNAVCKLKDADTAHELFNFAEKVLDAATGGNFPQSVSAGAYGKEGGDHIIIVTFDDEGTLIFHVDEVRELDAAATFVDKLVDMISENEGEA